MAAGSAVQGKGGRGGGGATRDDGHLLAYTTPAPDIFHLQPLSPAALVRVPRLARRACTTPIPAIFRLQPLVSAVLVYPPPC